MEKFLLSPWVVFPELEHILRKYKNEKVFAASRFPLCVYYQADSQPTHLLLLDCPRHHSRYICRSNYYQFNIYLTAIVQWCISALLQQFQFNIHLTARVQLCICALLQQFQLLSTFICAFICNSACPPVQQCNIAIIRWSSTIINSIYGCKSGIVSSSNIAVQLYA